MGWRWILTNLRALREPPRPPLLMIPGQTAYYCLACRWVCDGLNEERCCQCASQQVISIEALVKYELTVVGRRIRVRRGKGESKR